MASSTSRRRSDHRCCQLRKPNRAAMAAIGWPSKNSCNASACCGVWLFEARSVVCCKSAHVAGTSANERRLQRDMGRTDRRPEIGVPVACGIRALQAHGRCRFRVPSQVHGRKAGLRTQPRRVRTRRIAVPRRSPVRGIPGNRPRRSSHALWRALRQVTESPERRVRWVALDRRTGGTAHTQPATWTHLVQPRPAVRKSNVVADAVSPDDHQRLAAEAPSRVVPTHSSWPSRFRPSMTTPTWGRGAARGRPTSSRHRRPE